MELVDERKIKVVEELNCYEHDGEDALNRAFNIIKERDPMANEEIFKASLDLRELDTSPHYDKQNEQWADDDVLVKYFDENIVYKENIKVFNKHEEGEDRVTEMDLSVENAYEVYEEYRPERSCILPAQQGVDTATVAGKTQVFASPIGVGPATDITLEECQNNGFKTAAKVAAREKKQEPDMTGAIVYNDGSYTPLFRTDSPRETVSKILEAYNYESQAVVHNKKVQQAWVGPEKQNKIPNCTRHYRPLVEHANSGGLER